MSVFIQLNEKEMTMLCSVFSPVIFVYRITVMERNNPSCNISQKVMIKEFFIVIMVHV